MATKPKAKKSHGAPGFAKKAEVAAPPAPAHMRNKIEHPGGYVAKAVVPKAGTHGHGLSMSGGKKKTPKKK